VLFEYWKARPGPGGEASVMQTNGNPMRYADTPLGRIGSFICFDLDFPALVRQASRARVDLVIAPSNDWPAIDPWNTQMAAFRAIENGFNLVRDVSNGRSLAVDYLGRSLAETDSSLAPEGSSLTYRPAGCTRFTPAWEIFLPGYALASSSSRR